MAIHPKDIGSENPRIQCSVCGKWKRLYTKAKQQPFNLNMTFFGGCSHNNGDDHLAGTDNDVCALCCDVACKAMTA